MLQLVLSMLLVASPNGGKISYKKRVMLDPSYKSSWTKERIEKALFKPKKKPRRVIVSATRRVAYPYTYAWSYPCDYPYYGYPRWSWSWGWRWGCGWRWSWRCRPWYFGWGYSYPYCWW